MSDIPNGIKFCGYTIKHGTRVRHGGEWYEYDAFGDVLRRIDLLGPQRGPASVAKIPAKTKQAKAAITNKKSKYRNISTVMDGIRFASKAEAGFYVNLRKQIVDNVVAYFLMQVPIRLTGGVKYVVDFQVFYTDGRVRYIDVKGVQTAMFKLKKKQVEALYPIVIEVEK